MKFNRVTALLLSLTLAFSLAGLRAGHVLCIFCILFFCRFLCGAETKTEEQLLAEKTRSFPQTMPCGRRCSLPWTKHD